MMYNRRAYLKSMGMAAMGLTASSALSANNAPNRPNLIQILTDDQGWGDLGSFGHQFIKTPHIDSLAAEGIKFTHCYSACSVCSPSRASILTGRTPFRNGVYRFIPADHFCHLPESEVTLPQLLRKDGYQTCHFGKWHLSHFSEKNNYTEFDFGGELVGQPSMDDYGYDYWFATGNVARPTHEDPLNFFLNGTPMGKMDGFSAQIVATEIVTWMKEHRVQDKPFFITIWFNEPHGPVESDPEFADRYNELDDPSLRQYLGIVTQIDEAVGTIVASLKDAGIYDDTMIWFTSDNGPEGPHEWGTFNKTDVPSGISRDRGSTGGLRGRKRHTHEGGIRVPGIISWPNGLKQAGVMPGTISAEPIIGSDVFPTMLEAAGMPVPDDKVLDSASILPILQGKPFERQKPLYWRNTFFEIQCAIRDKEWKLVSNAQRTEFELHNLQLDPRETSDLSRHYPEVFERMKAQLIAYDKEVLAEGPDWWKNEERLKQTIPFD
jgi:arylsulfatase A